MTRYIFEHNKTMNATVSKDELQRRRRGNIITLSGQASTFVLETIGTLTCQFMIRGFFEPASFSCMLVVMTALLSASHVFSSPELRRYFVELYHRALTPVTELINKA